MMIAPVVELQIDVRQPQRALGLADIRPAQVAVLDGDSVLLKQPGNECRVLRRVGLLDRIEIGDAEAPVGKSFERKTRVRQDGGVNLRAPNKQRQDLQTDAKLCQAHRRAGGAGSIDTDSMHLQPRVHTVPIGRQLFNANRITRLLR